MNAEVTKEGDQSPTDLEMWGFQKTKPFRVPCCLKRVRELQHLRGVKQGGREQASCLGSLARCWPEAQPLTRPQSTVPREPSHRTTALSIVREPLSSYEAFSPTAVGKAAHALITQLSKGWVLWVLTRLAVAFMVTIGDTPL